MRLSTTSNKLVTQTIDESLLYDQLQRKGSSLDIKVTNGHKKTTPPKIKPSMRRRRATDSGGKENYHRQQHHTEGETDDGNSRGSSPTKEQRRRVNKNSTNKTSARKMKSISDKIQFEDIPIGQWIVLICLVLGLISYVRHSGKIKEKTELPKKKSKKVKLLLKRKSKNEENVKESKIQDDKDTKDEEAKLPKIDMPQMNATVIQEASKEVSKKKTNKKKKKKLMVVKETLKPSLDSLSTDGSSSANEKSHSEDILSEEFYYEDDFSKVEEEWTVVVKDRNRPNLLQAPLTPKEDIAPIQEETEEKTEQPIERTEIIDIVQKNNISFTEVDDEAFARMLQKEEEELAAANFHVLSSHLTKTISTNEDVWEEVKGRRNKKQIMIEEQ